MAQITIEAVRLHAIALPFVERLRTSFGEAPFKAAVLVELRTQEGITGWGECSAEAEPGYSYETVGTALHVLVEFLIPLVVGKTLRSATEIPALLSPVRGHPMAKHALEAAAWDALAQAEGVSLAKAFAAQLPAGHEPRGYAVVGVSIGIQPSIEATLEIIRKRLGQGYGRIKLKIEPGWDVELATAVRQAYPEITLMLDANSAYRLEDAEHLRQLDTFNLLMLEQPLGHDDIYEHSKLQLQLKTRVCLDESIGNVNNLRLALELGACRILNLKPARVGGYTESLAIYRLCVERQLPLWIGGLLETGIGRAANLAFASLPGVTLPSDISATDRYFQQDITEPPFVLGGNSTIAVPTGTGIGVEVCRERIEEAEARWQENDPYQKP